MHFLRHIARFTIFIPYLLIGDLLIAQNFDPRANSLYEAITKHESDTGKINLLLELSHYANESLLDYDTAIYFAHVASSISIEKSYQKGLAKSYHEIADVYRKMLLADSAFAYGHKSLEQYQLLKDSSGIAWAFRHIGDVFENLKEYDSAKKYYDQSLLIAQLANDLHNTFWSYSFLGDLFDLKGEYDEAIRYFELARDEAQKGENIEHQIRNCLALGVMHSNQGNYLKALERYQKGLSLSESIQDTVFMSWCYNNIGAIHHYQKEYDLALKYYFMTLEVKNALGDNIGMAFANTNIGEIYLLNGENQKAKECFKKTIELLESTYQRKYVSISYLNLGKIYMNEKDLTSALEHYEKAIEIANETGYIEMLVASNFGMGEIYLEMGNGKKAKIYALTAHRMANEIDHSDLKLNSALLLSQVCAKNEEFEEAYQYHVLHSKLADSMFTEQKIREIAQKEMEYKHEKELEIQRLEQEKREELYKAEQSKARLIRNVMAAFFGILLLVIFLIYRAYKIKTRINKLLDAQKKEIDQKNIDLSKKHEEINAQAKELQSMNSMKDKYFSILAHDLRGPFGLILGFLDIIKSQFNSLNKDELLHYLQIVDNSAVRTFKLLNDLLHWAKNQQGHIKFSPQEIQLSEIAYQLSETYSQLLKTKHLQLVYDVDEKLMVEADNNMITTVLRNLISNAIKFTPEGGKIKLTATQDDANTLISVTDTGVGMHKDQLDSMFRLSDLYSSAGTQGEKGSGLGLILSKDFIDAHSGKISVTSELGKGSEFAITIPNRQNSKK